MSRNDTILLKSNHIEEIILSVGIHEIMDQLILRLNQAIRDYDKEETIIPIRSGFNYQSPINGLVEWMPLHQKGDRIVLKCVGYHPDNPAAHGLPTILSTISAFDTSSGHLIGLMDCTLLTSLRTGAASAIATRLLSPKESNEIGIIGCGAQAITQIHALSRLFDIDMIRCFDIDEQTSGSFHERISPLGLDITIIPTSIDEILSCSDIVCTATSIEIGEGPLFTNCSYKPHLHINAVGSDFPGKVELPVNLLNQALVIPDFKLQAIEEGECQQIKIESIGPELFEIAKIPDKYLTYQSKLTVFDSTGWAIEDFVAMNLFLELANDLNIGDHVAIESNPQDAKNPYEFLATKSVAKEMSFLTV